MSLDRQKPAEDHVDPNIGLVPNRSDSSAGQTDSDIESAVFESGSESVGIDDGGAEKASVQMDGLNVVRGFCMGAANIVPGVSGGTVALVLGHYQRLIDAVSRIDSTLITQILQRRWRSAWDYVDARFLIAIGIGVVLGSVALAGLMNWLFTFHLSETFAVFFGMIVASIMIVRREVKQWTPSCFAACAAGAAVAFVIGRLPTTHAVDSLAYLFFAAAIAICAMILPGISGAFILLLLGVYHQITGLIKSMAHGQINVESLVQFSVFAIGCLFGLLAFSRVLSWMLDHKRDATMAVLVGLMVGSVEKLWPLQVPTAETADLKMKERVMEYVSPFEWQGSLMLLAALAVGSVVFVLVLERIAANEEKAG